MIPVKFSTTLIFSSRNFKFFQFLMNCPQWWKIRKILSVRWESGKIFFFQIQCQVYRNDPRQILYNFDFFVQELQFLMNCPQWWKIRKILSVRWEREKKILQIQCQVYRNDPRQILCNFDFFVLELQFFQFLMNCPQGYFKKHVFGHFWICLGKIQKNVFCKSYAEFQYGHFKLSPRSLRLKTWLGELQFFSIFDELSTGMLQKTRFWAFLNFSRQNSKKCFFQKLCGISLRSF